jgi:uncharacterized protein (DUF305 family)
MTYHFAELFQRADMTIPRRRLVAAVSCLILAGSALFAQAAASAVQAADPVARPDLVRYPYSRADVEFMAGMIPHHAQAVLIAGWASSHGAAEHIRLMCERMLVGQRDEIAWMRNWLRDRGQTVPPANATHHRMTMNGVEHDMLMPGMLSDDDLAELDKARGAEWEKLFLAAMIRHHEGAIKMIDVLFASHGALQDEDVYTLVSDMYADQTTEIERMQKLLVTYK